MINYLIRLGVEKRKEEYLSFPQRALFDKIGIRTMVMETDPFGNLLTQGYELIIPSHDLVVVRMGHFKGDIPGRASFRRAMSLLMEAVPMN